ncbi:MAG: magnesium and cobalt transport protein CorA, partial [Deltaproteobacteria bacterium]|nr:magnesium and cobalt transport protein CorA [Deltaproteobacteria bacterium]
MTRRPAPRRPRLARALGTPGLDRARGLSPGTPLHVGEAHGEAPRLRVMTYGPGTFEERELSSLEELGPLPDAAVTWLDVDGLHDTALLRAAGDRFDLHPMLLEDIANTTQRPKLEVFGDRLFVVCKMLSWDPVAREVRVEQLALLLGAGWVITFQERPGDVFDPLRDRIRRGAGRVRSMGAAYLAYALLDAVVDGYFGILEHVGNALEPLEEQMIREGDPRTVQALHRWRHEILMLR